MRDFENLRAMARFAVATSLVALVMAGASSTAFAQAAKDKATAESDENDKEIVVTGTLIRGKSPIGSNAITISEQRIQEVGAISGNALLASIPQVTNYFNRIPVADLGIAVNQIQISRPNIRNISANNASSSATLILVDGHRIASAGVNQASIDPDLIPTGAIERVEVVTEGGSATYGADAVAGVINFITLKKFDGVKVNGHYGFAKNYWQYDASLTAGKSWDSGSAYVSYSYNKTDALYGRERGFIHNLNYSSIPFQGRDRACVKPNLAVNTVFVPANFTISAVNYALPGLVANTFNACDNTQDQTIVPKAERHGVIAGLTQNFGDSTSIDARAYYGQRITRSSSVLTGLVNVNANNPYTVGNLPAGVVLGGGVVATRASVNFSLQPLLGLNSQHSDTRIKEWGANAELKHDLSDNWQVRALFNWSASDSRYDLTGLSNARLATAGIAGTLATAFNPFDVTRNDAALIRDLTDSEIAGQAKDNLINFRAVAEGKLFALPGGDVRLAFGYEFVRDKLKQRFQSDVRIGQLGTFPFASYSRNVHSAFGELQLPLLSDGNGGAMFVVSASGRYDHYSDFGDTFNPKVGATFKPSNWLTLRGNWGTSFTAPTPIDQLGSQRNTISSFPFVPFLRPGDPPQPGAFAIALQGSQPNLQPQKADTFSVGFDINPVIVPGVRLSVSYYDVNFKDTLRTPTPNAGIFTDFPANVTTSTSGLTPAQLRAFGALAPGGSAVVEPLIANNTKVYETVDFRTGNFGILRVKGLDVGLNAKEDVSFGSIDFGWNLNVQLSRKQQASPTAAVADVLATETPRVTYQMQLGTNIGNFRAQATLNHTSSYRIITTAGALPQNRVSQFNTANLFFKYDVPGESRILKDLSFTLNIDNVFNQDPPVLRRNNPNENGYANGFTLGRLFQIGISKKF